MAARSANVNVRVEPDIKKQAEDILDKLGVSAEENQFLMKKPLTSL